MLNIPALLCNCFFLFDCTSGGKGTTRLLYLFINGIMQILMEKDVRISRTPQSGLVHVTATTMILYGINEVHSSAKKKKKGLSCKGFILEV